MLWLMTGSSDPTLKCSISNFVSLFNQASLGKQGKIDVVILRGGISIRPRVHVKESKSKPFCDSSKYPHIRNGRRFAVPCRFASHRKALESVCAALLALHVAALGISLTQKTHEGSSAKQETRHRQLMA